MKKKTLLPENITKAFRKFDGTFNIQIDNKKWLTLQNTELLEDLIDARKDKTLKEVTITEDGRVIALRAEHGKEVNKELLELTKKIYRHG